MRKRMGCKNMGKMISAGKGYWIEVMEGGYKVLHCPDDVPGEMGHGTSAYKEVSLFTFKRLCAEFIQRREEKNGVELQKNKQGDAAECAEA